LDLVLNMFSLKKYFTFLIIGLISIVGCCSTLFSVSGNVGNTHSAMAFSVDIVSHDMNDGTSCSSHGQNEYFAQTSSTQICKQEISNNSHDFISKLSTLNNGSSLPRIGRHSIEYNYTQSLLERLLSSGILHTQIYA